MKKLLIPLCLLCVFGISYAGSFGVHFKGGNVDKAVAAGIAQVTPDTEAAGEEVTSLATGNRTLGSGSNRCLVAAITFLNGSGLVSVSSVTYDGTIDKGFTKLGDVGTDIRSEIWYANATDLESGVAGHFDIAFSGNAWARVDISEWTGVNQSTPLDGYVEATGESATPSVNVTSETGAVVIDVMTTHSATATDDTGGDSFLYGGNLLGATKYGGISIENGAASVTASWSISLNYWSICAASLNPA
jgi:hypothetical protein